MPTRIAAALVTLLLGVAIGACVPGDSGLHLSEQERADAAAYLNEQLADGQWQLGAHTIRVDAHGWAFERDWDALRVVLVAGFVLAGGWLAWALGRNPGPWRVARIGAPIALGSGIGWLLTSMPSTEIDLDAGTAAHHRRYLGWTSSDALPLAQLRCRVSSNRSERSDGSSSDFSYFVVLVRRGDSAGWNLVETGDEALGHALCERLHASFDAPE